MSDPFESLRIRVGERGDWNRVRKDWTTSHARSDFARWLTPRPDWGIRASQTYWTWQKAIVEELLARGELWIATWAEAPSAIVGWAVLERRGEEPIVHYVDVLPSYRRNGVARRLLAPALESPKVFYTHRTALCKSLPIPPGWSFDPRLAVLPKESPR